MLEVKLVNTIFSMILIFIIDLYASESYLLSIVLFFLKITLVYSSNFKHFLYPWIFSSMFLLFKNKSINHYNFNILSCDQQL